MWTRNFRILTAIFKLSSDIKRAFVAGVLFMCSGFWAIGEASSRFFADTPYNGRDMRRPAFLYHIGKSLRHVLHDKKILGVFAVMAPVMFLVMFFLPIKAIPGNDVAFQLLFFGTRDYILLAVFSFFGALVIAMQVAVFRQHGVSHAGSGSLAGGAGVMSALFSVFFATSVCVLCAGALFGFVGF